MVKNGKGSNERQLRNEARKLLAMPEDERNAKLSLMRIVKADKAERIEQLMAEILAESTPEKGEEKKPAEIIVVEKAIKTEPEMVPEEEKPENIASEKKEAEPAPETSTPEGKPGRTLWEGKMEEPKKERRIIKKDNRRKLQGLPRSEGKAFIISLMEISEKVNGNGHVNAMYTGKKGIEMSISTHAPFIHKIYGSIIPVVIQTSTVPNRRQPSRKLEEKDVGSWVRKNVSDWKSGIYMARIGHTNILSNRPINVNKEIVGLALISSKKVEQKGRETQYFPHIIILGTDEEIKPAFSLVINDEEGDAEASGQVHIGRTIGAKRDNQDVGEYLHLIPCEQ